MNRNSGQERRCRFAFTLIEVLVVTGILGVVGMVIASAFGTGIRVWERAQQVNEPGEEAELALARFTRELMNARPFYAIAFNGGPEQIEFPGRVAWIDEDGYGHHGIGGIAYSYDRARRVLLRRAWSYPGEKPDDTTGEEVLGNVFSATFSYFVKPETPGDDPEWTDTWNNNGDFPLGARLEIAIGGDRSSTIRLVRTARFCAEF